MNNKNPVILVIDDEEDLLDVISFDLEDSHFNTLTAKNEKEVMAILEQSHIDVILSDVRMPFFTGIDLLEKLRRKSSATPLFFFMTGHADISIDDAYHLGCDGIFYKPLDLDLVIHHIKKSLDYEGLFRQFPIEPKSNNHLKLSDACYDLLEKSSALKISRGGFFIHIKERLPQVGDGVNFTFAFNDRDITGLEGHGICRWVRTKDYEGNLRGAGITFESLSVDSRTSYEHILQKYNPRPFIYKG